MFKGHKVEEKGGKNSGRENKSLITFVAGVVERSEKFADKWFIDYGASAHICNSEMAFDVLEKKE